MDKRRVIFTTKNGEFDVISNASFNRGRGNAFLLDDSIKMLGLARSIVVDNANNVICGHKVVEACTRLGINKAHVIETEGDELIIVKRKDVVPGTKKFYELSLVDNLLASKLLDWDSDEILQTMYTNLSFDARRWGGFECLTKELDIEQFLREETVRQTRSTKQENANSEANTLSLFEQV